MPRGRSNRISANVSGFLGTTRITLNDNLLNQGTPDEVLAVLGHEMGHYVMGHILRGLILLIGPGDHRWLSPSCIGAFASPSICSAATGRCGGSDDIAGLPLLVALASLFFFLATPLSNTITRSAEHQADIFGLDAVRKPDAFATAMLKLSTYRKLEPGNGKRSCFYDHPSGRTRIDGCDGWKKEHIRDADIRDTVSPQ